MKEDWLIRTDCTGVDWGLVSETLKRVGMAWHPPDLHRKAFEASYQSVFVYRENRLIGFGRAISDGTYQAAIYDVAVIPEYQRAGIGTAIMHTLLDGLPSTCNVILYAAIGKEGFYRKSGFRHMKTGMARFTPPEVMQAKGFTD